MGIKIGIGSIKVSGSSGGVSSFLNTRTLSEAQTFYVPSDAVNGDVVGTIKAYPEFEEIGSAPNFSLKTNNDSIYAVNSGGVITIADNTSLAAGNDSIVVTVRKSGFVSTDVTITITCVATASCIYIDPDSATNGAGTRNDPKNAIPNLFADGQVYLFKRGTAINRTSSFTISYDNVIFTSYGVGAQAAITATGNDSFDLFSINTPTGLVFSELEICTASPVVDMSNWIDQLFYGNGGSGSYTVSHCYVHHANSGGFAPDGFNNMNYLFNRVEYMRYDGFYAQNNTGTCNIIGNHITKVAQYYFTSPDPDDSPGDGIQLSYVKGATISHNYIDRSDTGNKFCIISFAGDDDPQTITDNYLICPDRTGDSDGSTGIYIESSSGTVLRNYIEGGEQGISVASGNGDFIIAYNILKDHTIAGVYGTTSNIYNNLFIECALGIVQHTAGYALKNNIFMMDTDLVAYNSTGSEHYDYNLYSEEVTNMFGIGRSTVAGQTGEDNSIIGDPLFYNAANGDYRLTSESPAIGEGVLLLQLKDYYNKVVGYTPDIGVNQYETLGALAPYAYNLAITGDLLVGSTLTGSYSYFDANGNAEGTTTFRWLRADDTNGTNKAAIAGATSSTYELAAGDEDKYVIFEVTPKTAVTPTTGTAAEVYSSGAIEGGYEAGYQAILDEMTTEPSEAEAIAQNTLYKTLSDGGVLSDLDFFFLYYQIANAANEVGIDWKAPTGTKASYSATAPTWTTKKGFTGVPANDTYIETGYNPGDGGAHNYALNDCCLGAWVVENIPSGTTYLFGATNTNANGAYCTATKAYSRMNNGLDGSYLTMTDKDNYVLNIQRVSSSNIDAWQDKVDLGNIAVDSVGIPNRTVYGLAANTGSADYNTDATLGAQWGGKALTEAKIGILVDAIQAYKTAVDAI